MKLALAIATLLLSTAAFAAEHGGGHGLDAHQIKVIIYQSINVSLMLIGLVYFAKKPVQKMLADKKEIFVSTAAKAEEQKKKVEQDLYEMKIRLSKLETTAEESVMRARAEAADLKKQIIEESLTITARIKTEAEATAKLEIEKAKRKLRDEMILQATQLARKQMETGLSNEAQQNLKDEFIQHMGGV